MSNELSTSLSISDGINLSILTITNTKTNVSEIFKYVELLPFEYPKYQIAQPMLVGVNGQPQIIHGRLQSEFTFNIVGIDNESKDSIMQSLTKLNLIPPDNKQLGTYKVYHIQLQTLGIQEVYLLSIEQPTWSIGKMIWKFKCREGTKPMPIKKVDATAFTNAENNGLVLPTTLANARAGVRS